MKCEVQEQSLRRRKEETTTWEENLVLQFSLTYVTPVALVGSRNGEGAESKAKHLEKSSCGEYARIRKGEPLVATTREGVHAAP